MIKMAHGPKYRVPFRRRKEGKTNYHRRLKLIISHRNRLVIRCSTKHTTVQIMESLVVGDKLLAQSHSSQLKKDFGWKFHSGNIPSAYLTGYLCGLKAKKAKIEEAILDVGILVHNNRVKAAFKGFLDAGIEVPHNENWFFEGIEDRIQGIHIRDYAKFLSKENPKYYKRHFAATLKNKADPGKIEDNFKKLKTEMENKVK